MTTSVNRFAGFGTMNKTLLVVHHSPSINTQTLIEQIIVATKDITSELIIKSVPALECPPEEVLACDAILLFTPENLGYMSGGMKDFFDRCYYPCLDVKQGLPVAAIIRAGHDGTGTERALETIVTGLKWRWVQAPLICKGEWRDNFIEDCVELAQTISVSLEAGII